MRSVRAAEVLPFARFSRKRPRETKVTSMVEVSKKVCGGRGRGSKQAKTMARVE